MIEKVTSRLRSLVNTIENDSRDHVSSERSADFEISSNTVMISLLEESSQLKQRSSAYRDIVLSSTRKMERIGRDISHCIAVLENKITSNRS